MSDVASSGPRPPVAPFTSTSSFSASTVCRLDACVLLECAAYLDLTGLASLDATCRCLRTLLRAAPCDPWRALYARNACALGWESPPRHIHNQNWRDTCRRYASERAGRRRSAAGAPGSAELTLRASVARDVLTGGVERTFAAGPCVWALGVLPTTVHRASEAFVSLRLVSSSSAAAASAAAGSGGVKEVSALFTLRVLGAPFSVIAVYSSASCSRLLYRAPTGVVVGGGGGGGSLPHDVVVKADITVLAAPRPRAPLPRPPPPPSPAHTSPAAAHTHASFPTSEVLLSAGGPAAAEDAAAAAAAADTKRSRQQRRLRLRLSAHHEVSATPRQGSEEAGYSQVVLTVRAAAATRRPFCYAKTSVVDAAGAVLRQAAAVARVEGRWGARRHPLEPRCQARVCLGALRDPTRSVEVEVAAFASATQCVNYALGDVFAKAADRQGGGGGGGGGGSVVGPPGVAEASNFHAMLAACLKSAEHLAASGQAVRLNRPVLTCLLQVFGSDYASQKLRYRLAKLMAAVLDDGRGNLALPLLKAKGLVAQCVKQLEALAAGATAAVAPPPPSSEEDGRFTVRRLLRAVTGLLAGLSRYRDVAYFMSNNTRLVNIVLSHVRDPSWTADSSGRLHAYYDVQQHCHALLALLKVHCPHIRGPLRPSLQRPLRRFCRVAPPYQLGLTFTLEDVAATLIPCLTSGDAGCVQFAVHWLDLLYNRDSQWCTNPTTMLQAYCLF